VKAVQWKFVGQGCGTYEKTQQYSFVGQGGSYVQEEVVTYYGWKVRPCFLGLLALAVLLVVAVLFWPQQPTTTTTIAPPITTLPTTVEPFGPIGTCTFWGDPHVLSFDGARLSFYGTGDFWIVKSQMVKIQGRYMGTVYTHGLSATNKIAISGDFINGHVIEVGTMESGQLTVDGQPVLGTLGSTYSLAGGLGTLSYDTAGDLPDKAAAVFHKHIVHMILPEKVTITVFRWGNYLDLRIEMPQQDDQDGSCGNFNGNPADDTTAQIFARIGARVPPEELIFRSVTPGAITSEMQKMIAANCDPARLAMAKGKCQTALPAADVADMDSCVFDECFGKNQHALRVAKTYG